MWRSSGDLRSGDPKIDLEIEDLQIARSSSHRKIARSPIWLLEASGSRSTRLTFDDSQEDSSPLWTQDGKSIVYSSRRQNVWKILVNPLGNGGPERVLAESEDAPQSPMSWSPGGDTMIFMRNDPTTGWDLGALSIKDGTSKLVLSRPVREGFGQMSPDGKWLAYHSNETGRSEVYVTSFPPGPFKRQISYEGGVFPLWSADGKELYFNSGNFIDGKQPLLAVTTRGSGTSIEAGRPHQMFAVAMLDGPVSGHLGNYFPYAVTRDGKRFLMPLALGDVVNPDESSVITVATNWHALRQ